jgi:hypothetical protein
MNREPKFLLDFFFPPQPTDPSLWHQWVTGKVVRTVDGKWTTGTVWRRKKFDGRWQYQRRKETDEEWFDSRTY